MAKELTPVIFEALHKDVKPPVAATKQSAGYDVQAYLKYKNVTIYKPDGTVETASVTTEFVLEPGCRVAVPLGFKARLPEGWEAQVRTRSGLALKNGIIVANSPGTIDSDYPGEWMVILLNTSQEPFKIEHGARIAQVVIKRLDRFGGWEAGVVDQTTDRSGGFGSTGA